MTTEIQSAKDSDTYRSLTQIISSRVRKKIYEGHYKPGQKLSIAEIAQEFQSSAIPVREALRKLEADGLVDFRLNRGVVIRSLSADDVRELFLIRRPLEILSATQTALHASPQEIAALKSRLKEMDQVTGTSEWHSLHEQFHNAFYALSKLPHLTQLVDVMRGQMRRYAELYLIDPTHVQQAQAEHYKMLEMAAEKNIDELQKLVRQHLNRPARMALLAFGRTEVFEFADDSGAEK